MIQMIDGEIDLAKDRSINSYHKLKRYDMFEVGMVTPELAPTGVLKTGQVGYFLSNMKSIKDAHIGDTFYLSGTRDSIEPFPGYEPPQCMVYSGIYPESAMDYEACEKAIQSLLLTDGSISFQYENSAALGGGFRLGFLGMLHLDIFRQRLKDEHGLDIIITHPSVNYRCHLRNGDMVEVDNPNEAPDAGMIDYWEEAICDTTIMVPREYMEAISYLGLPYFQDFLEEQVICKYRIPLGEMIGTFFDRLKSSTSGYASVEYKVAGYEP